MPDCHRIWGTCNFGGLRPRAYFYPLPFWQLISLGVLQLGGGDSGPPFYGPAGPLAPGLVFTSLIYPSLDM